MPFNSYQFVFAFLPIALIGFWLLTRTSASNGALSWLTIASVAFYAYAGWRSLLVVAVSILLTYVFARLLLRTDEKRVRLRRVVLSAGIAADVALLCYFKYNNFLLDAANALFTTDFELGALALPLGISFLTFQKVAFLFDVHAGRVSQLTFLDYMLFTLFFPRALSGPIVRYEEVVPQFSNIGPETIPANVCVAVCLFSIGLFKKVVIGDSLGEFASPVFYSGDYPRSFLVAWSGVVAYTLQLYFDFSGYSDMALGTARLFGVRLPINFNSPLRASSIIEFWSRWHITLTRFLTNYIYTPIVLHLTRARVARGKPVLRGKRTTLSAIVVLVGAPTLATMAISGVWHGAGWQFVIWGVLHGAYLTINQSWRILRPRFWADQKSYEQVMKPLGWVLTFGAVVIAMVFFRANSVGQAIDILAGMFGMNGILSHDVQLLQDAGVNVLEAARWVQPFEALAWDLALLACVLLLPNSLEVLQRFDPALDFVERHAASPTVAQVCAPTRTGRIGMVLHSARMTIQNSRDGVGVTRLTAAIVALLWMLGVMAISSSDAFIYGQF